MSCCTVRVWLLYDCVCGCMMRVWFMNDCCMFLFESTVVWFVARLLYVFCRLFLYDLLYELNMIVVWLCMVVLYAVCIIVASLLHTRWMTWCMMCCMVMYELRIICEWILVWCVYVCCMIVYVCFYDVCMSVRMTVEYVLNDLLYDMSLSVVRDVYYLWWCIVGFVYSLCTNVCVVYYVCMSVAWLLHDFVLEWFVVWFGVWLLYELCIMCVWFLEWFVNDCAHACVWFCGCCVYECCIRVACVLNDVVVWFVVWCVYVVCIICFCCLVLFV